jgi:hypothetical protein
MSVRSESEGCYAQGTQSSSVEQLCLKKIGIVLVKSYSGPDIQDWTTPTVEVKWAPV